jgi:hypothetical protein
VLCAFSTLAATSFIFSKNVSTNASCAADASTSARASSPTDALT